MNMTTLQRSQKIANFSVELEFFSYFRNSATLTRVDWKQLDCTTRNTNDDRHLALRNRTTNKDLHKIVPSSLASSKTEGSKKSAKLHTRARTAVENDAWILRISLLCITRTP